MPIHAASDPIMTALLNELNTLRALKDQIYADAVKLDEELADVNQMQRAIMQALADMYGEHWKDHTPDSVRRQCESRRYIGAYTMTEDDVLAGGDFDDEVAYGGWTMDDHHPAGFRTAEPPTIFHPAPSPYGIPYRCLYSEKVDNLMFAGRNISVTHAAMSSTRVMATCALLGQAVGTAAAIAVEKGCSPAEVSEKYTKLLQAMLQQDDCFLPHHKRNIDPISLRAVLSGDGQNLEALLDGIDRPRPDGEHAWKGVPGDRITYSFAEPTAVRRIRLVFDSDLNRETLPEPENGMSRPMFHNRPKVMQQSHVPTTMLKAYRITAKTADGHIHVLADEINNYQRLRIHESNLENCLSITLEPLGTWGHDTVRIFAFEVQQ